MRSKIFDNGRLEWDGFFAQLTRGDEVLVKISVGGIEAQPSFLARLKKLSRKKRIRAFEASHRCPNIDTWHDFLDVIGLELGIDARAKEHGLIGDMTPGFLLRGFFGIRTQTEAEIETEAAAR